MVTGAAARAAGVPCNIACLRGNAPDQAGAAYAFRFAPRRAGMGFNFTLASISLGGRQRGQAPQPLFSLAR
jgi:hypothetical protein